MAVTIADDLVRLLTAFECKGESASFSQFVTTWRETQFGNIHVVLSLLEEGLQPDAYQELYAVAIGFWSQPVPFAWKVGAAYALYMLYMTQPLHAPACIRVAPWEWRQLQRLMGIAIQVGVCPDFAGVVLRLVHGGAMVLCAYSGRVGLTSIARGARVYGLHDMDAAVGPAAPLSDPILEHLFPDVAAHMRGSGRDGDDVADLPAPDVPAQLCDTQRFSSILSGSSRQSRSLQLATLHTMIGAPTDGAAQRYSRQLGRAVSALSHAGGAQHLQQALSSASGAATIHWPHILQERSIVYISRAVAPTKQEPGDGSEAAPSGKRRRGARSDAEGKPEVPALLRPHVGGSAQDDAVEWSRGSWAATACGHGLPKLATASMRVCIRTAVPFVQPPLRDADVPPCTCTHDTDGTPALVAVGANVVIDEAADAVRRSQLRWVSPSSVGTPLSASGTVCLAPLPAVPLPRTALSTLADGCHRSNDDTLSPARLKDDAQGLPSTSSVAAFMT